MAQQGTPIAQPFYPIINSAVSIRNVFVTEGLSSEERELFVIAEVAYLLQHCMTAVEDVFNHDEMNIRIRANLHEKIKNLTQTSKDTLRSSQNCIRLLQNVQVQQQARITLLETNLQQQTKQIQLLNSLVQAETETNASLKMLLEKEK